MHTLHHSFVAICPSCDAPFPYVQCVHSGVNDEGGWVVECPTCTKSFKFRVLNPHESSTQEKWRVTEFSDWPGDDKVPAATDIVMHNLPQTKLNFQFNLKAASLYQCERSESYLDAAAYAALRSEHDRLEKTWRNAENYLLARNTGGGPSDKIMVLLDVPCPCGEPHKATFYAKTYLGASSEPLADRCLLAHIDGTNLEDRLNCLASKTESMELLEKLLIRWHVTAEQIVLASPFVGHQYMKPADVLAVWKWLFSNTDPKQVTIITRKATWTQCKTVQEVNGVTFSELERYGLQDKAVTGGVTKHDFHAKFFAGISTKTVEVLSGSANLVRGPSIENISFHRMLPKRFKTKYLDVLKKELPLVEKRRRLSDALILSNGRWTATSLPVEPWVPAFIS